MEASKIIEYINEAIHQHINNVFIKPKYIILSPNDYNIFSRQLQSEILNMPIENVNKRINGIK